MLAMKDEPAITLKMNSHPRHSTLVEVFECVGEVEFAASSDYKKFMANESSGVEHSKTAGHYVIKLPSNEDSDLQFARIKPQGSKTSPNAVFVFRYSYFSTEKYPFGALSVQENSLKYHFE